MRECLRVYIFVEKKLQIFAHLYTCLLFRAVPEKVSGFIWSCTNKSFLCANLMGSGRL